VTNNKKRLKYTHKNDKKDIRQRAHTKQKRHKKKNENDIYVINT